MRNLNTCKGGWLISINHLYKYSAQPPELICYMVTQLDTEVCKYAGVLVSPLSVWQISTPVKRWQGFSPMRVQKSTGVRTTTNTLNMWWSTLTLYVSCVCTPAVLSILNSLFLNDSQKEDWLICHVDCFMCSYRWAALFSSLYLPSCSTFCTLMPKRGTWQFTWSGSWWYL